MAKAKTKAAAVVPFDFSGKDYEPVPGDFVLKEYGADSELDTNFASQSFWKEVRKKFFHNKGAVVGLVFLCLLTFFAIVGPFMTPYSYSEQSAAHNLAPRIQGIENMGIFDGSETMTTTTGSKKYNGYAEGKLYDTFYWFGTDKYVQEFLSSLP